MSTRFDDLSKDLAFGLSRRKAFLGLGAGLAAAVVGLVSSRPARADGIGEICDATCKPTAIAASVTTASVFRPVLPAAVLVAAATAAKG